MLMFGELGETSLIMLKLGELVETSFGMLNIES